MSKAPRFEGRIAIVPDLEKALDLAQRSAGGDGCVLAAGSLYLIGEIKKIAQAE
jgi:folylpolyglutamate synthase/dihydropteroate synthase